MKKLHKSLALALSGLSFTLLPLEALAGAANIYPPVSTCTTADCAGAKLTGTYSNTPTYGADPYIIQVFSTGNECVRVSVTREGPTTVDTEAVLVSPDGTVWRDDDSGGGLRPLIKANTTVKGWHTLIFSRFNGGTPVGSFDYLYARYPLGNPNCSGATVPSLAPAGRSLKR